MTIRACTDTIDRSACLADSFYFAGKLIERLEALEDQETEGRQRTVWQWGAARARRIRRELRKAAEHDRARRIAQTRRQASRR